MKIRMIGWIVVLALALCGCAARETFETLGDVPGGAEPAERRAVSLELPKEAASPVMDSERGQLYLCTDYEIGLQTLAAGDLNKTVQAVTGYGMDALTVMKTELEGLDRYDLVWTAAGENGQQMARAAILDDGNYHYVLTAQAAAEKAGELHSTWNDIFESFGLD